MSRRMPKLVGAAALTAVVLGALAVTAGARERTAGNREGARVAGRVTAIDGNTFNLQTRGHGELRVQVDASTRWRGGSQADLQEGSAIGAAGKLTGDVLHADTVAFLGPMVRRHTIRGEITSTGDHTFTMRTRRGEVTVRWNDDTRFKNGTPEDLVVGARIGVVGHRAEEGSPTINARGIIFPPERPAPPPSRS